VGGERVNLLDLEREWILTLGEPRVHFALHCVSASCPRLVDEPWRAEGLDAALDAAVTEYLDGPHGVRLDEERQVVQLSSLFDWYADEFLAQAPSVVAWVNRHRTEPVAEDWAVEFLEYDWTLIDAARAP
jgi:hypothetical protein